MFPPPCSAHAPFLGFVQQQSDAPEFYDHDGLVAHLLLHKNNEDDDEEVVETSSLPRLFSIEVFGEVFALRLDGLWAAQQLGAHDDYAPHRVQTLPCGQSWYEAEMLLQMHAAYPAPFFACLDRLPALRALFFGDATIMVTYDQAKKAIDDFYFAFFAWLAALRPRSFLNN
jgi:hypothetical protein